MNIPQLPLAFLDAMSPGELFLVLAAILLFFGPRRLPELARKAGRVMSELRRASQEFKNQIMQIEEEPRNIKSSAPDVGTFAVENKPGDSIANGGGNQSAIEQSSRLKETGGGNDHAG
jgi:TatA/E family protein of Tat protein translocase